jgi:hypothetical protein
VVVLHCGAQGSVRVDELGARDRTEVGETGGEDGVDVIQFDELAWIEVAEAVRPIETRKLGEVPVTYPFGA